MKKYQMLFVLFMAPLMLLAGFKKNTDSNNNHPGKPAIKNRNTGTKTGQPEVSIVDAETIQGNNKEGSTIDVLVFLSEASTEAVTMEYITENGTGISGVDYVAANGSLRFEPCEITKWITVSIKGEIAADPDEDAPAVPDLSFRVKLQKVINAIPKKINAIISIIKNIAQNPRFGPVNNSVYEIHLSYKGNILVDGDPKNCKGMRPNGETRIYGYLKGNENVGRFDPIRYTGVCLFTINMDICTVDRNSNGEDEFCVLQVTYVGDVTVDLEIDSTTEQGGYIKIAEKPGLLSPLLKKVSGSCTSKLIAGEYQNVPDNCVAAVFNGRQLSMLIDVATGRPLKTLKVGEYREKDEEGNITRLKVLRKVR